MKLGHQLRDALRAVGIRSGRGGGSAGGKPQTAQSPGSPDVVAPTTASRASAPGRQQKSAMVAPAQEPPQPRKNSAAPVRHGDPVTCGRSLSASRLPPRANADSVLKPAEQAERFVRAPRQGARLVQTGPFRPHELFLDDPEDDVPLPGLAIDGIASSLTARPTNETDLIVGLDFGTSATKVVIRDAFAATSVFPVKLSGQRQGIAGYLLPSRVFRTGNVYSLRRGTHRLPNLKLALLGCKAPSPVTEFNDCCAFLALVIRRARAWLLTEHRDIYAGHALNWRLNLGIAARSYEDVAVVNLFRRLAWAAANLASDADAAEITVESADRWRVRSRDAVAGRAPDFEGPQRFTWDDVDVVPEVSAQIQGFMTAARWDWGSRPVMMLVDVGAGTVDTAMFHVRMPSQGAGVLTFYSNRVDPNGAMNLHRERVRWLQSILPDGPSHDQARTYLADIERPTDRLRPLPESVDDYVPGYRLDTAGQGVDGTFRTDRYRRQVAGCINDAKVAKGIGPGMLASVPLLLCGGGSRMRLYGSIQDAINGTRGWAGVSVDVLRLPVPRDLSDSGLHAEDFDRLSVAYGLSLSGDGGRSLGTIVRAVDVPDVRPYQAPDISDRFISKDQL